MSQRAFGPKWTQVRYSVALLEAVLTIRMVIWKQYVILFGGFIDVGVKSEFDWLPTFA
jgi:hypothetical protein